MSKIIKVSIITPVYNAEKTIKRCINSLLKQSYKNIEIILINDGSKDKSLRILNNYEKKYSNIYVINQENKGAGAARNNGLLHANGEYVTFVDADDELKQEAIENMVQCLEKSTDIIVGGFKEYDENGKILIDMVPKKNYWTEFKFTSTMFKLYKKKYLLDNKILFADFNVFEDLYFCLCAYSKTQKIEICSKQDYIIYKNMDSITSNFSKRPLQDCVHVLNKINDCINLNKYPKEVIQFFYLKTIVLNIIIQLDGHDLDELNSVYIHGYKWLKSQNLSHKNGMFHWQKYEDFWINLCVNLFYLFTLLHITKVLIFILKKVKKIRVK